MRRMISTSPTTARRKACPVDTRKYAGDGKKISLGKWGIPVFFIAGFFIGMAILPLINLATQPASIGGFKTSADLKVGTWFRYDMTVASGSYPDLELKTGVESVYLRAEIIDVTTYGSDSDTSASDGGSKLCFKWKFEVRSKQTDQLASPSSYYLFWNLMEMFVNSTNNRATVQPNQYKNFRFYVDRTLANYTSMTDMNPDLVSMYASNYPLVVNSGGSFGLIKAQYSGNKIDSFGWNATRYHEFFDKSTGIFLYMRHESRLYEGLSLKYFVAIDIYLADYGVNTAVGVPSTPATSFNANSASWSSVDGLVTSTTKYVAITGYKFFETSVTKSNLMTLFSIPSDVADTISVVWGKEFPETYGGIRFLLKVGDVWYANKPSFYPTNTLAYVLDSDLSFIIEQTVSASLKVTDVVPVTTTPTITPIAPLVTIENILDGVGANRYEITFTGTFSGENFDVGRIHLTSNDTAKLPDLNGFQFVSIPYVIVPANLAADVDIVVNMSIAYKSGGVWSPSTLIEDYVLKFIAVSSPVLSAPVLDVPSNSTRIIGNGIFDLKWSTVSGAERYIVLINGSQYKSTVRTNMTVHIGSGGDWDVSVVAVKGSELSPPSNVVTLTVTVITVESHPYPYIGGGGRDSAIVLAAGIDEPAPTDNTTLILVVVISAGAAGAVLFYVFMSKKNKMPAKKKVAV